LYSLRGVAFLFYLLSIFAFCPSYVEGGAYVP
jgi:hypothetical protein